MISLSRPNPTHSRQRGFTLAEVLVATAIFTVIVLAALMIYDRSNQIFKASVESGDMQQNTRSGFDRLVSDVRMAGFDYDRDGVPSRAASGAWQPSTTYTVGAVVSPTTSTGYSYQAVTGGTSAALEPATWPTTPGATFTGDGTVVWRTLGPVFQQPDEQIEYAGRSAIVVRANYDFHLDVAHEHGRENVTGANYEPTAGQFPVVTTANDEIVIYALRSDVGGNDDTLSFYADVDMPRSAYPGGNEEDEIEIPNIDLCDTGCNNPPYTLYRFTIQANGSPDAGTPIANNVRDLQFRYYSDLAGTALVTELDGTAIAFGAIGGDGQYDPDNVGGTTNYEYRTVRSSIVAISAQLVGMSSAPDGKYQNPTETLAAFKNYRTYSLESHVTPRNLGLAGMSEPSGNPPGPATITSVCTGSCKVTRIAWAPPLAGTVRTYEVHYDTSSTGSFDLIAVVVPGDIFSAPVMNLVPGTTYYFKIVSVNENGESVSALYPPSGAVPINETQPSAVSALTATAGAAAEANQITLEWPVPGTNASPLNVLSCVGTVVSGANIDPAEPIQYRIWRGTAEDFDPTSGEGELVLDSAMTAQPTGSAGTEIAFIDSATNSITKPPANCKSYWYRIQTYDTCSINDATAAGPPALNEPPDADTGTSTLFPAVADDGIPGYASSTIAPAAPGAPTIDYTNSNSECDKTANTCDVKIVWPKVTADTNNPTGAITVDQYRIKRERKKAADTTWVMDTFLPVVENASSDASVMEGTNVVAHDTSALDHDPVDKKKWYYQYTVYALQCGTESGPSPTVQFPESCGLASSAVIQTGAASGDGSLASPWLMNATDFIEVIPPAGVTLNRVEFEIYPEPNPDPDDQPVDKQNTPNAPFVYAWTDQADGAVYRVVITMTNDSGCTEQTERFIQDDPIVCPSATTTQTGAASGAGIEGTPWLMNAGDTVTVNQPVNATITSVVFTLTENSSGTAVGSPITIVAAPFTYTWVNQTDNVTYKLAMTTTFADGCIQDDERFITDEAPPVCVGATASVTGDASGNNGAAQGTPWLLNGGDSITINPPTGGTINQVAFTVTPVSPAGTALAVVTDSSSPFTYTWSDQTDNTVYRVDAVITYSSGCTEIVTVYAKDQVCSGAATVATGSTGAGTGLTTSSRWVFASGDKVAVTPPAGVTITDVSFVLKDAGGSTVDTTTDATSPYEYNYTNQIDDNFYTLTITVTYTAGCSEIITRHLQDEGKCFISVSTPVITHADDGSQRIASFTYTVTNPSSEALTISGIKFNWARDAGHPVAVATQVIYTSGATSVPQTVSTANDDPPTTGVITPASPPPLIPALNSAYTVTIKFDIGKKSGPDAVTDLSASWINSLCLQYSAPSFGGSPASCNVLGSTSVNPSACN